MYLKLKNVDRKFETEAPMERIARGAENGKEKNVWIISFNIKEHLTTDEIETYFTPENIVEMAFVTPLPNGTEYSYVTTGYVNKVFNIIRHSENGECVVEFQFSKNAN